MENNILYNNELYINYSRIFADVQRFIGSNFLCYCRNFLLILVSMILIWVIKWHHFDMEQYIPYSLICDLFSKNMYATPALILNWLASRLIALDLNLIPQHYPLTVCFLLYIYINLYKTLSFQLFMDLADIAFEFAPYINRTFFGT